jgi:hypothetical protein
VTLRPSVESCASGLLLCDAVQRCVVIEAEIARVYDVVGLGFDGQVIQRSKIAWMLTSVILDALFQKTPDD